MKHCLRYIKVYVNALVMLLLLSGCASLPRTISITLPLAPTVKKTSNVQVLAVRDQQEYADNQGVYENDSDVQVKNVLAWLRSNAISSVNTLPCQLHQHLGVVIDLRTMYVGSNQTDLTGAVVLRVHFKQGGRHIATHSYRGQCSRLIWVSSTSDIPACFDEALKSALLKMQSQICRMR